MSEPLTFLSYALAGTAALLLLLGLLWWWRRDRPDAAELERRRRLRLNRIGRIADGRIVELRDELPEAPSGSALLIYNYRVRGVEYQAAQEIAALRERLDFRRLAAGQPARIKYDPQNPTNSIVLCEDWSGV